MIIKRAAIQRDDNKQWFYLPPFSLDIKPSARSIIEIDQNDITGKIKEITNKQIGWDVSISGIYKFATEADGLTFQQGFRDFLRDSTGASRKFHLIDWQDDTGTIKRCFQNCYLSKDLDFSKGNSKNRDRLRSYSFALTGSTYALAATSTDGTIPGSGPYEVYTPTSSGGSAGGGSGSGLVVIYRSAIDSVHFQFENKITATTGATNYPSRQLKYIPDTDRNVYIRTIQICGGGALDGSKASGQTTVKVSTGDYAAGAPGATVSVAYNTNYSSPVSCGDLLLTAGNPLYLYVTEATGGHSDLEVILGIERQ